MKGVFLCCGQPLCQVEAASHLKHQLRELVEFSPYRNNPRFNLCCALKKGILHRANEVCRCCHRQQNAEWHKSLHPSWHFKIFLVERVFSLSIEKSIFKAFCRKSLAASAVFSQKKAGSFPIDSIKGFVLSLAQLQGGKCPQRNA